MLTLKTWSPENGIVGSGRWVVAPSRQQPLARQGECQRTARDLRSRRASQRECVVTREIRQPAHLRVRTFGQA